MLTIVDLFVLGRWDLPVGFEEAAVVEPVDPFEGGVLEVFEAVRAEWGEIVTRSHGDPTEAMAARLDVPPSAMGWRLFNLGLVEEKPARPPPGSVERI